MHSNAFRKKTRSLQAGIVLVIISCTCSVNAQSIATKFTIPSSGHPLSNYNLEKITEVYHAPRADGVFSQYGTTGMTNTLGAFFYGFTGPYGFLTSAYGTYGQYGSYGMYNNISTGIYTQVDV